MESWQSGNAPDSKSGEPVLSGRAGSNPVLSFFNCNEVSHLVINLMWHFFLAFGLLYNKMTPIDEHLSHPVSFLLRRFVTVLIKHMTIF